MSCRDVAPDDLQFLTEEDIAQIGAEDLARLIRNVYRRLVMTRIKWLAGAAMTHIETMRLQAALAALQGTLFPSSTRIIMC